MKELNKDAFYTCPYCGTEYSTPTDLAHCILSCEEKQKKEEADRKVAELALQKEARKKEIEALETKRNELLKAYLKDYGSYNITREYDDKEIPLFWKMLGWY